MVERFINKNNVSLCAESCGDVTNPPLLLIMGACASMIWWPKEFCQMLAAAGFYVIRYDNRDTGRSTCYEPGTIHYNLDDMVEDAATVLEGYGLPSATVVGASLGGMIAQLLALKHPGLVRSLVLIMSGPVVTQPGEDMPAIAQKVLDHHAGASAIDWGNKKTALDFMVEGWRITAGSRHPFDAASIHSLAEEDYDRSKNLLSSFNHALLSGGEWAQGELSHIKQPTLIIHGTEDPVLPLPHAEYLQRVIPGAKLVALKGGGHEIHFLDWPLITRAIHRFVMGTSERDDSANQVFI